MDQSVIVNIGSTQYEVITEIANELKWKVTSDPFDKECDVIWQDNALNPDQLNVLRIYQRINHFPGMYAIARKDHLGKNLKAMKQAFPEAYDFFPPTWVLPKDLPDLKNQFNSKRARTFICKPEALSQGKGIILTRNLEEIPERCVVQRYLHKPYLIDGLKFDLRVYVLVLGCDPLKVYVHQEGLVRLATESYTGPTANNLNDVCMHLTNYAINKNSEKFQFNSDAKDNFSGHKRSLKVFFDKLKLNGENVEVLLEEINSIIVKTLCVAQPLLAHLYRSSQPNDPTSSICFQILGFDIFLDNKLKPYLLEVNHTPSFTTDTPLDLMVKKAVIGDALRMLGLRVKPEIDFRVMRNVRGVRELRSIRTEIKEKWIKSSMTLEEEFKGGYKRIYPIEGRTDFDVFMMAARDVWLSNLGVRKKSIKEPGKESLISSQQPSGRYYKATATPKGNQRVTSVSPLFSRSIRHFYPPLKKTIQKLPALKLAYGSYIQPRVFAFADSGHTIVMSEDLEKRG